MAILEHEIFHPADVLRRVPREELEARLQRFRSAMDAADPQWQMAVISDKLDMYYFTGTMQDGALIIRPGDEILWVRRSYSRACHESLLPDPQIRRMKSYRQPAEYYGSPCPDVHQERLRDGPDDPGRAHPRGSHGPGRGAAAPDGYQ